MSRRKKDQPEGNEYELHDVIKNLKPGDRVVGTPTIFDLEEVMVALEKADRVGVWATRRRLRWLVKSCQEHMGIYFRNPYDL